MNSVSGEATVTATTIEEMKADFWYLIEKPKTHFTELLKILNLF